MWDVRSLVSVLDCYPANVPLSVDIQQSVLIEIASLCDLRLAKLDVERVGVLKILNLHELCGASQIPAAPLAQVANRFVCKGV